MGFRLRATVRCLREPLGRLLDDQFALGGRVMSQKNELTVPRARPSLSSARTRRLSQRRGVSTRTIIVVGVTAILALAGLGSKSVAASSSSAALGSGRPGDLNAVSSDSANDAWAVGGTSNGAAPDQTLAIHWNGTGWSKVASPNPGGTGSSALNTLDGISAHSATDAWAIGWYENSTTAATETLVLHWNGTSWSKVTSPNPGGASSGSETSVLNGVSARSAADAWAVGYYINPTTGAEETLVLHWNGTGWSKVASPNPAGTSSGDDNALNGVSAASSSDAWAVGFYKNPTTHAFETLVLHWNGTNWGKVVSPNPGGTSPGDLNDPIGVSTFSATSAWAVGDHQSPTTGATETLLLHWNGTNWSTVASPNPGGTSGFDINKLPSVSADSATDAWAVGFYQNPTNLAVETLILHGNGSSWSRVTSPNPGGTGSGGFNRLNGVSARAATDAWAVGSYTGGTLVLHWNGTRWTKA
jgi:hypothetical protein